MNNPAEVVEAVNGDVVTWPLAIVSLVALVLVVGLLSGRRLFAGTRNLSDSFWCPFRGRFVDVEFKIDAWEGQRVDVVTCSAFTPSSAVTCDKRCASPPRTAVILPR